MDQFLIFLAIFFTGLFFAEFFNRVHLPWVITLLLIGVALGPFGFAAFTPNAFVITVAEIGLIMLAFNSGLEARLASLLFLRTRIKPILLALSVSLLVFLTTFLLVSYSGLAPGQAFFASIVVAGSSALISIPLLEAREVLDEEDTQTAKQLVLVQELVGLVALAGFFEKAENLSGLALPFFYLLFFGVAFLLYWLMPIIRRFFSMAGLGRHTIFRQELHTVFIFVSASAILFYFIGVHVLVAAYFIGLLLSSHQLSTEMTKEKIRAVSYGLFIPIFFIVFGSLLNLKIDLVTPAGIIIFLTLIFWPIVLKYLGMLTGLRLAGVKKEVRQFMASLSVPQFSLGLTVAYVGLKLGVLNSQLVLALVFFVLISSLAGTAIFDFLAEKQKPSI